MSDPVDPGAVPARPWLASAGGWRAELNAHGGLHRLAVGDVNINLFAGTELEPGPAGLVLRRFAPDGRFEALPLCGPLAPLRWFGGGEGGDQGEGAGDAGRRWREGRWQGLRLRLELVPARAASAWFWHLAIDHQGEKPCSLDLVYLQDVALARWPAVRLNEAYVSQYIDHQPIVHERHGWLVASRQNAPVDGRCPWLLSGCLGEAAAYATDALQLAGADRRHGLPADTLPAVLPSRRLQHEHSLVALQTHRFTLQPGEAARHGFFGWFEADHAAPSGPADLGRVDQVLALPEAQWTPPEGAPVAAPEPPSLLLGAPPLDAPAAGEALLRRCFGSGWRHVERDAGGRLLSFFSGEATHVVLPAKDAAVLRPHGHLLRSGHHTVPDEAAVAGTVWMAGVFQSSFTQGHASANRLLSTQRGYLGLQRGFGLRMLADFGDGWRRLELPSAWGVQPQQAQWLYRHGRGALRITTSADARPACQRLRIEVDGPLRPRLLLLHHIALGDDDGLARGRVGWRALDDATLRIEAPPGSTMAARFPGGGLVIRAIGDSRWSDVGGDERLYGDGRSREQAVLCMRFDAAPVIVLDYEAALIDARPLSMPADAAPPGADLVLRPPGRGAAAQAVRQLADWLPWLTHNALVHYLSPRGLEQFSGGGWGTRDVCQGPVEWLRALGRHEVIADLLQRVFSAQNSDGDWPQWFMFFERDAAVRAGDSHGDIVFWPLLALARHLAATGDAALLDVALPFHAAAGSAAERAPLRVHVERAFAVINRRRIDGTALAAYGHGDWNDALQPADPAMREHLCSAWTVTLHHEVLAAWREAWQRLGRPDAAAAMQAEADAVRADFQRLLIADGVLAGYASFDDPGRVQWLLHPRDQRTGIRYSALAMVHAIIDELFTPEQADAHAALIAAELSGPDGLRLFDHPLTYRGGVMQLFQRGESASYFGREIGLMYMHAHLRWAEALAQLGRGDALLHALRLANPIGLEALVPSAAPRQRNCYYSSSDAAFADRVEAQAHYAQVRQGGVALEGGWRIYSSGAGIAWRLVVQRLLGLTVETHRLHIDPVLPPALDRLDVRLPLAGIDLQVRYRVGPRGHGPLGVVLNGRSLPFTPGSNRYRAPGVDVTMADWQDALRPRDNRLEIVLG